MVHFFFYILVFSKMFCFIVCFFFGTDQRKETKYPQFIQIFIFLQLLMKQNSNLKEWEKTPFPLSLDGKTPRRQFPTSFFMGWPNRKTMIVSVCAFSLAAFDFSRFWTRDISGVIQVVTLTSKSDNSNFFITKKLCIAEKIRVFFPGV